MTMPAALALAARGFKVFPLTPGEKAPPLIKGFPEHATTDADAVRRWWTKWPAANVGLHCAGLLVLDVDVRNDGPASLRKLDMFYGLPETLTAITPTGGKHLYYRLPEGHPGVGNSAGKLGAGLDVKTTGGYVVAPGSSVAAGKYRFEADVPIAPAPEWLVEQLGTIVPKSGPVVEVADAPLEVVDRARDWLATQPAGEGAYATACGLRDLGVSLAQAQALMAEHDPRDNVPGKVEHAYEYAKGEPGAKAALPSDFEEIPVTDAADDFKATPKARTTVQTLAELADDNAAARPYIVKGLLTGGSHAVMFGAPGAGKSFVALDMAYHVAAGRPWHGRRVRQGSVLYLSFEGYGGLRSRAKALRQHYGAADVPVYLVPAAMDLRSKAGREELGQIVGSLPQVPTLIVIDTLARALAGGDENSAQDMGAFNRAIDALIRATGATVLLIHHSGKDSSKGARGSSALLGAIDTELCVEDYALRATKQRDVELGDPIGFELRPIQVGVDEDGEPVTSCVVLPRTLAEDTPQRTKLRGNPARAWSVLCDLTGESNTPVTEDKWRIECEEFAGTRQRWYDARRGVESSGLAVKNKTTGLWSRKLE